MIAKSIKRSLAINLRNGYVSKLTNNNTLKISTLSNGIRVATEEEKGHFCGIGAYISAGCRFENQELMGVSHFMDRLAFKSTLHKSRQEIMNTLENFGGNISASTGRENIMYQAAVFNHHAEAAIDLMADAIIYPAVTDDEMIETRGQIMYELSENFSKPEWVVPELAHQTAFFENTYGFPQICLEPEEITREKIEKYRQLFYRPSRIVLAAVGLPHEYFCQKAEQYFGRMKEPNVKESKVDPVKYTGGFKVQHEINPKQPNLTRIFLGFESTPFNAEDVYATSVLQMLLGGGDSFSAGGPGKGMYSRLYTRVLNRYYWVESITATNTCYKDSGLFGFQATVPSHAINNALQVIAGEIHAITNQRINHEELERAKNQLKSYLFMNMEAKLVHLEDIGRQVQLQGTRICPSEMSEKIEKVTEKDIKRVMLKMISKKPTFVLLGEKKYAPREDYVMNLFGFRQK